MIRSNRTHLEKATEALMTLVLLFQPTNDAAAQLPTAGTLDSLGMNISGPILGGSVEDLIQASGIKCFRTGLPWWYVERTQGVMQYHPTAPVPIACSEWGYSTVMPGITEEVQGNYLARVFLINLSEGVVQSNWFDWRDEGTNPACYDHHFGTLTYGNAPKPADAQLQTLIASLKGKKFSKRLSSDQDDWLLVFASASGSQTLAAWTTRTEPHTVLASGWGTLELASTPIYVDSVPEPEAKPSVAQITRN